MWWNASVPEFIQWIAFWVIMVYYGKQVLGWIWHNYFEEPYDWEKDGN